MSMNASPVMCFGICKVPVCADVLPFLFFNIGTLRTYFSTGDTLVDRSRVAKGDGVFCGRSYDCSRSDSSWC